MTAHELALKMRKHREEYRKKPKEEQIKIATDALMRSGMIDENGEFTDNYAYSRDYYRNTRRNKS